MDFAMYALGTNFRNRNYHQMATTKGHYLKNVGFTINALGKNLRDNIYHPRSNTK